MAKFTDNMEVEVEPIADCRVFVVPAGPNDVVEQAILKSFDQFGNFNVVKY
jgi:hypothetical protein